MGVPLAVDVDTLSMWSFNEDSGEDLLNEVDGVPALTASGPDTGSSQAGRTATSRYLDSMLQEFFSGGASILQTNGMLGEWTVEFWMNRGVSWAEPAADSPAFRQVLSLAAPDTTIGAPLLLTFSKAGMVPSVAWDTNGAGVFAEATASEGVSDFDWTHVLIRRVLQGLGIYRVDFFYNAQLVNSVPDLPGTENPAEGLEWTIGADVSHTGDFFDGYLDEMRVSRVARTEEEITTSYNRGQLADEPPPPDPIDMEEPELVAVSPPDFGTVTALQPILFEVNAVLPEGYSLMVVARFSRADTYEVIHDGQRFFGAYREGSTRAPMTGGFRYDVRRSGGWPESPEVDYLVVKTTFNAPDIGH